MYKARINIYSIQLFRDSHINRMTLEVIGHIPHCLPNFFFASKKDNAVPSLLQTWDIYTPAVLCVHDQIVLKSVPADSDE